MRAFVTGFVATTSLFALGAAWISACSSTHASDDGTGDETGDGGSATTGDAAASADAASFAASGDATIASDASLESGSSNGTDAATPLGCIGDRAPGVTETYPDSFLIQNGGRVYNLKSPPTTSMHAAMADGVTDDTQAFLDAWDYLKQAFLAHNSFTYAGGYVIYLPKGTYLVSDTLIYRGASLEAPTGYVWDDVVDVRFAGESREGTIIRLADKSAGFADPTNPKIVLAYQHPTTRFNNIPGNNALRNLTVDTGSGNPGAVGVFFQGANLTAMRNVAVRSEDGDGAYGIWMKIGSAQGDYRDLRVDGFRYGIFQNSSPTATTSAGEVDTSFEHVTLTNQTIAAVGAGAGFSARALCADETATGAQGLKIQADGTQAVLIDSDLKGASDAGAIESTDTTLQSIVLRDVTTEGYASAVVQAGAVAQVGPDVTEWSALPTTTLFDGGVARTLHLPIAEEPIVDWYDPASQWANVDDYGAVGDGKTDDSAAVQLAMASGKPVVVFRKATYLLKTAPSIPATVHRVDILYSDIGNASFDVTGASTDPLLIERGGAYGTVTLKAARPLVLHEMSASFANQAAGNSTVYLENLSNSGGSASFAPVGSTTWARGLNDEEAPPATGDIVADGGTLWIFNYKTENKAVTSLLAANGSTVEVLNGYVNSTIDAGATSMIVNDRSNVSFVGFTNLGFYQWKTTIEEIRASGTEDLAPSAFPSRDTSTDIFIPLYSGDAR